MFLKYKNRRQPCLQPLEFSLRKPHLAGTMGADQWPAVPVFGLEMASNAYKLEAWSLAWCCGELIEMLRN